MTTDTSAHMTFTEPPTFNTTPVQLDYVDFVSHLGTDFMSSRKPVRPAAPVIDPTPDDTAAAARIAYDAALEAAEAAYTAWQDAIAAEARTHALSDTWRAFLIRSEQRLLARGLTVSATTRAAMDALCDRVEDKTRLAKYRVANARSDYYMAVLAIKGQAS